MLRLRRYGKIDRKSAISLQPGQFDPKFHTEGVAPHYIISARIVRHYNFVADSFHITKLCCRLSLSKLRFYPGKPPFCVFELFFLGGGLWATYDYHLRFIVVDFLLVLIELFLLGVTAEALQANIGSKSAISLQQGPVDPIFQVEGVAPTRQTDRQTDRQNYVRFHAAQ